MNAVALGLAAGVAGIAACYAIAFVVARATADPRDDFADAHGDWPSVPPHHVPVDKS